MGNEEYIPASEDAGGGERPEDPDTIGNDATENQEASVEDRRGDGTDGGTQEGVDLEERLELAEAEAARNLDRFLRASAELENVKKRSQREMGELRKYANQSLIKELLTVVDNLERAIESSRSEDGTAEQLLEGVDLTLKEILKILEKHGVTPIDSLEKPFDPAMHEAVLQEALEGVPENTVIREFQRGYWMHDRLLRPAMVVVSKT
jgi:molecular chaperone GrpE